MPCPGEWLREVLSGGSIGRLPLGASQLARRLFLLYVGADGRLAVGSACVTCSSMERSQVLRSGYC